MKRTHRDCSNKNTGKATGEKAPLVNACTVTELKIEKNDNRLSRPEKKHGPLKRPAMLRGRSHEQTSRANARGKTSFSSNSYNSLGGGDPTRIAAQQTACSSHQSAQKQITTACAPKVRPTMTSNATHARTNRTASNGPMRAAPAAGEQGRVVPPMEGPKEMGAQKVTTNVSNRQHNRDERYSNNRHPGRDNSLNRNKGYPASNKPSNSSLRGTSPSSKKNDSGLKSTTPASVGSVSDAKRYVPKRSSSIDPNLRGNDPHGPRNIKANKQNKSQSQSTGDLNSDEKIGQQRRGQSHRTEEKPWLKKGTRAGQSSLPTIEIYTPEGRYGDKNSRNQVNSNILPVDLTEDTARPYDSRKENSHVSADKRTAEKNADVKETARNCDTFPPTRSQNFDGENMKNILYFSEVNEPEDKHHRKLKNKSKNLEKSEKEVNYDVVQPDAKYFRSRRADSFNGAATRYIFSGAPEEEGDDSNNQFINDSGDEDHQAKLRENRAHCFERNDMRERMCDNSWKQSSTKTKVKFVRKGDKSMREIKNNFDEEDQLVALRANRTACLGGDSMRNTMCDDHLKPRKGKNDNFSKVGENLALIREYNDESDEDQLDALRANRNACLGGDSMRNVMCDDHLKPRKGKKDNFSKVGENVALMREYNEESEEEDQLASLRANRNACLGGDSMRNVMCDDHLKPRKGKKDNLSKVGENVALIREYNDDSEEEDQLAALRANRNACLGGDSMRNVMCDDHLKPGEGKKDNFSKVGENVALIRDYNDDSEEEDQLAALRANRNACLGGDSMRNVMCDDHLKPRKGKKDNFSKFGENVALIRDYNDDSEEEDQLAALRANRNACLGGDSMRNVMCDDHLKPRKGKKDNFSKVGENVALIRDYNDDSEEEDQLAALRANRNACLGGDSMRNVMCDDHLKPRKGKKDNFSKVGENVALIREYNDESEEEDQLAALRANRNACLGGDSMRNVMCDDHLKPRKGKKDNFSKVGENVALIRDYNDDSEEEDQLAALRANRNACLGGDSMRNVMCDDHLKPRKGKKDNFSKVGENVALIREYNDESEEEDQLAALRANRNACLGGDTMRNVMCDDHLKPRKGKKDNFSKVGENVALIREYNDESEEEDQLAALRANRNACLGGDSMRNVMCDDHLKPRKGKKDNFSKVGENITLIREYNDEIDEEDQLAALRANRNACLGGDSMRNILYDDHLKVRRGKTDNFSKVGENISLTIEYDEEEDQLAALRANRRACLGGDNIKNLMCDDQLRTRKGKRDNFSKVGENIISIRENEEDSDEDQLATLRANRTACLGGSSMKTLMSDDHLKPRRGRKDNFSKVGENIILMTRNNQSKGEKNQLTTSRANRIACPGSNSTKSYSHGNNASNNFTQDTEEDMKSNRTANMSGSEMRNILCSQNITPPSSRSRNRKPLKKSLRSSSVSGTSNLDTEEAMKTNRAASMGGCDMKNIVYGQNPFSLSFRSRDTTQLNKSVRSSSVSGRFDMKRENNMNLTTNVGDSDMKNIIHDRNSSRPASRTTDRNSFNKSARSSSISGISTDDADKAFKANCFAGMGGSNMKTLLYGNANSGTRNTTPLKKSVRCSSVSGTINGTDKEITTDRSADKVGDGGRSSRTPKPYNTTSARSGYNIDADEAMKTNRSRSIGASNMRNLLHETIRPPPISRSDNRSDDSTVTMGKNARPQRSSSTEGSDMKSLLYGGTPSSPASIATRKAPLKKSLRGSAGNSKANKGPMKAIHSIKSDSSDMNIGIYGDAQIPSGEGKYQDASAESVDYSISRRPSSSRRSRSVGPLSVSEIQEENQEILRTNRYKGIGGNNMKNILYGGNTYGDETGKSNYNYNEKSNASENGNINTSEIQEYNQEILRANRFKGIGGSNMKSILYGATANSYESDSNYECTTRCDNPFMDNSPRDNEEQCPYIDPLPEKKLSSRKGYGSKSETPRYEAKPVIRHSAFEGDTMKTLLYGDYAPVTSTKLAYQSEDNYQEISDGEAAIEIQAEDEYPSCTSLHQDAPDEENITLEFFSVESPEEPVGVLIPYDVINQFAPECGDNIERTAVALKHGHLVDCTCRMKMRNQQEKHPCVRHILPKDLQFYNEASKVLDIISSPFDENDRKISAIENNLARKYPNYYSNFVQKFNCQLSVDYRTKEQQSKLGVITSYKKLLAEENSFSKRAKCPINKRENISGKIKNLEKDFHTACKTLKKDYPFLFVQLLQEYDFPSLALEKNVVEKNRMSLLDISQLGNQKLQEFEEMFTNQQFHE